ncbi:MAG TPA: transposase [Pseudolabrys sp.]|nr:transposase [Pseudolabrys sp.]
MARHPRVHLPDVPLHIVQRGHNREPCFFTDDDYHVYMHWLQKALTSAGILLHAYVLMTNHVHLLITPSVVQKVPRLLMSLGRRYVQYVNRKYGRTGTLWDCRYRSCLIQSETYLLACQRYIELNPVRAAMVEDPAQYRWSSYRFYAFGRFDPLLTPRVEYLALGDDASERQRAYRKLFEYALTQNAIADIRLAVYKGRPLGNAPFRSMIERVAGRQREARPRGRPRKLATGT